MRRSGLHYAIHYLPPPSPSVGRTPNRATPHAARTARRPRPWDSKSRQPKLRPHPEQTDGQIHCSPSDLPPRKRCSTPPSGRSYLTFITFSDFYIFLSLAYMLCSLQQSFTFWYPSSPNPGRPIMRCLIILTLKSAKRAISVATPNSARCRAVFSPCFESSSSKSSEGGGMTLRLPTAWPACSRSFVGWVIYSERERERARTSHECEGAFFVRMRILGRTASNTMGPPKLVMSSYANTAELPKLVLWSLARSAANGQCIGGRGR